MCEVHNVQRMEQKVILIKLMLSFKGHVVLSETPEDGQLLTTLSWDPKSKLFVRRLRAETLRTQLLWRQSARVNTGANEAKTLHIGKKKIILKSIHWSSKRLVVFIIGIRKTMTLQCLIKLAPPPPPIKPKKKRKSKSARVGFVEKRMRKMKKMHRYCIIHHLLDQIMDVMVAVVERKRRGQQTITPTKFATAEASDVRG